MNIFTLGPLTTNGLAMLTKKDESKSGIMITASHNPFMTTDSVIWTRWHEISDKIEKIENLIDTKTSSYLSEPKLLESKKIRRWQ